MAASAARSLAFLSAILGFKRPDDPFTRQLLVTMMAITIGFALVSCKAVAPMDHTTAVTLSFPVGSRFIGWVKWLIW